MSSPPPRATVFTDAWREGPARPELEDGEVHVWRIDIETDPTAGLDALAPDERRRARSFLRRPDGDHWARSRAGLRSILARYLGLAARDVEFVAGRRGKPRLQGAAGLQYNLTHSGDLALCAVGRVELGVDIERNRRAPMAAGVAAGIVSPEGPIRPDEAPSAELDWVFFQVWTRVEAALKATGEGLSAIDRRSPEWVRSLAQPGAVVMDERVLHIIDLPTDDGYLAALAAISPAPPVRIRCWSLSGG